jgi:hypothetical protein
MTPPHADPYARLRALAASSRSVVLAAECRPSTDELATLLGEHHATAIPGAGLPAAPSDNGEGRAMVICGGGG